MVVAPSNSALQLHAGRLSCCQIGSTEQYEVKVSDRRISPFDILMSATSSTSPTTATVALSMGDRLSSLPPATESFGNERDKLQAMQIHEGEALGVGGSSEEEQESRKLERATPAKLRVAGQTVAPFLAKHIPDQYAPLGIHDETRTLPEGSSNTKYCYRHRPDLKCRRQADEPSMEQLQKVRTVPRTSLSEKIPPAIASSNCRVAYAPLCVRS